MLTSIHGRFLGVDRFVLGYTGTAVGKLLTLGTRVWSGVQGYGPGYKRMTGVRAHDLGYEGMIWGMTEV